MLCYILVICVLLCWCICLACVLHACKFLVCFGVVVILLLNVMAVFSLVWVEVLC